MDVSFAHPANWGILAYLGFPERLRCSVSVARGTPSASPSEVRDPYYHLGSHPDLVERLWDELTVELPEDCRWVVHGTPALVRPSSGIIFGFCGGTHTYAVRLPAPERQQALAAGATRVHTYSDGSSLDLAELGEEWVFGHWLKHEERWCLAAYEYAAV